MDMRLSPSRRVRRHRARQAFPIWVLFAIPLFIGLAHAAAHGGTFFFGPFFWLPIVLFWHFGRRLSGPRFHDDDEYEETPRAADAERDRLGRIELELVDARRQIRDLQDQLAWHVKLLAAQQPTPAKEIDSPPGHTS
jgi:hypothetical protein